MQKSGIPQLGESAGPAGCQPNPAIRILVVDDDPYIRHLSAHVLIRQGYAVSAAEDGAAAWEALQASNYDLLITDHQMPKVTGVELVRKVRSAQMPLPVIMASGTLPEEELGNAWLQPVATLAKPFSGGELLRTVTQVLAQPGLSAPRSFQTQGNCQDENQ